MSYLIVLGAGPDQIPAFKTAKKMGIETVAVDYNPNAPGFQFAGKTILASVKDTQATLDALRDAGLKYKGVMTLGVEISPVVSAVAKAFSLPAVSEETAFLTTNKCARNEVLKRAGIPIARFEIVKTAKEISMEFPFVIKPSDNSASRGVQIVDSEKVLNQVFNKAKALGSDGRVLIEEQLHGPEISIEGFMLKGTMYVTGFADRNYTRNVDFYPFFIEDGGDYPSVLPEDVQEEARKVFEAAAKALGIENGPSKGDLIVTPKGVKVIEITSRLSGGGFCSRIVPLQTGVELVTETIRWACGQDVDPNAFQPKWCRGMSHRFLFHQSGRIRSIQGLEEVKNMPGIVDLVIQRPFKVGDWLDPLTYANRLLYVVSIAEARQEATFIAEKAIASIHIEVENQESRGNLAL